MVQIIVLAAVALFLFWRLKSVLGSRQGFEKEQNNNKRDNNSSNISRKSKDEDSRYVASRYTRSC